MKKITNTLIVALAVVALGSPTSLWANHDNEFGSKNTKWHNERGSYQAGDFHNHTTFTDGSTSIQRLEFEALDTYGLDWFAQSGHGGQFSRDGRLDDFYYDCNADGQGDVWQNTVGPDNIKGDPTSTGYCGALSMWRWQSLQEFAYPKTMEKYRQFGKPIWQAFEYQVPGHEHCSTGNIAGQFNAKQGNIDALAQFEYLFDMEDNDFSEGGGQGWTGKIPNPPKDGVDAGIAGHAKAVKSVQWLQRHYPETSYLVWAHIERKGSWNKDKGGNNTGYNVEHFRDFNNAGREVAFGFEGQPGHQASGSRGGFGDTAFGGTRGGTGKYSAEIGGLWDALLGEGRHWFNYANSDYHSHWTAGGDDFYPGEYQKTWVNAVDYDRDGEYSLNEIADGLRSGNAYFVHGDLINALEFKATDKTFLKAIHRYFNGIFLYCREFLIFNVTTMRCL